MPDPFSSLVSYGVNVHSQERAFQQQKELQQDAQRYNTLMFNLTNAYNSPAQQMARFKAAGLNPNLMYGQMANTASAPSISAGSAPSPAQMQAPSLLETAQLGLIDAQKENIEADTQNKLSDSSLKDANSELLKAQKVHVESYLNPYYETMSRVAHQEGLHAAIQNWLDGYVPVSYDENGRWTGDQSDYAEAYTKMNGIFNAAKQAVMDEYHMTHKDREHLDKIFEAMVDNDVEQLNSSLANLRANNATLQKLADKEWFQVANFIVTKLGDALGGITPVALGIANVRTGRMNAATNSMNATTNRIKALK